MAPRRLSISALVLLMLASQVQGVQRVKVDAVLKFCDELLMLIAGDNVLYIIFGAEARTAKISEMGFPEQFHISAAARSADYAHRFFYGPDFYYDRKIGGEMERFDYCESLQKFFGDGGPDAVAWRDDREFFFKGCMLATFDSPGKLRRRNAKKLGLPCKPDAAWTTEDGSKIISLKGDQIWIWDVRKNVEGPKPFSSMYNVTSWELIPSGGGAKG